MMNSIAALTPSTLRHAMYIFRDRIKCSDFGRRSCIFPIVVVITGLITALPVNAALVSSCALIPGTSCSPPDDAGDGPGTLLATQLDPFSFTSSSGITHGAVKTEVFREAGGTLDFYYIAFNAPDSATSLMEETDLNFAGWATSVAFRSDGSTVPGFVNGNIPPSSAARDGSGSNIQFSFGGVPPNERSRVVVISTNAFYFAPGTITIDGSGPLQAFQPSIPEPGCFLLFGSGLLLLALRKKSRMPSTPS